MPIEDRPDARRSCSAAHESIRTKIAELEAVETDEPRTDHTTHEHAIQRFKHEDTAQFRDRIASITGQDPGIAAEITRPTFTPMQTLEERAAKYGQPTIQYPDIFKLPE